MDNYKMTNKESIIYNSLNKVESRLEESQYQGVLNCIYKACEILSGNVYNKEYLNESEFYLENS